MSCRVEYKDGDERYITLDKKSLVSLKVFIRRMANEKMYIKMRDKVTDLLGKNRSWNLRNAKQFFY